MFTLRLYPTAPWVEFHVPASSYTASGRRRRRWSAPRGPRDMPGDGDSAPGLAGRPGCRGAPTDRGRRAHVSSRSDTVTVEPVDLALAGVVDRTDPGLSVAPEAPRRSDPAARKAPRGAAAAGAHPPVPGGQGTPPRHEKVPGSGRRLALRGLLRRCTSTRCRHVRPSGSGSESRWPSETRGLRATSRGMGRVPSRAAWGARARSSSLQLHAVPLRERHPREANPRPRGAAVAKPVRAPRAFGTS